MPNNFFVFNTPVTTLPGSPVPNISLNPSLSNINPVANPVTTSNNQVAGNMQQSSQQSSNGFNPQQSNFYFPLPTTVHTWNTKKLLPSVLLSQYVPFSVLFLIDDLNGSLFTGKETGLGDSIIFGAPTDTVDNLAKAMYSSEQDTSYLVQSGAVNKSPNQSILDQLHTTMFFNDALKNNVYKLSSVKGIPAQIIGYAGNATVNLIPLSLKMSQLTTPDARGVLELNNIDIDYLMINGWLNANFSLSTYDINQMFTMQTVAGKLFQSFNKYLLMFGWQGPGIENIDFSNVNGVSKAVQSAPNVMTVTLADGSPYDMYLPTPLVDGSGLLRFPNDGSKYIIDLDDTDNGNMAMYALYGAIPSMKFEGTKITVEMKAQNAGNGFNVYNGLQLLTAGGNSNSIRKQLVDKLNQLSPIAFINIAKLASQSFLESNGKPVDAQSAEGQQIAANIKAMADNGVSAGTALINENITTGLFDENTTSVSTNDGSGTTGATIDALDTADKENVKQAISNGNFNKPGYNQNVLLDNKTKVVQQPNLYHNIPSPNFQNDFYPAFKNALNSFAQAINSSELQDKITNGTLANSLQGVRTYDDQESEWNAKGPGVAMNPSNHAGMHQLGCAADIGSQYYTAANIQTALNYNLVFRYPTEPWHIELAGYASVGEEDSSGPNAPTSSSLAQVPPTITTPVTSATTSTPASPTTASSTLNTTQTTTDPQTGIVTYHIPAAYRLGDIITTLAEAVDYYLLHYNGNTNDPVQAVQNTLIHKYMVTDTDPITGKKIVIINNHTVSELDSNDIFGQMQSASFIGTNVTTDFKTGLQNTNLPAFKNIATSNVGADLDKYIINNQKSTIAEEIAYTVVSKDQNDSQYSKFMQLLNHFETIVCGSTMKNLDQDVLVKNITLNSTLYAKLFSWEINYQQSFNPNSQNTGTIEPITVADIPVSVETTSRILQTILYTKSIHELINQTLLLVSLDYGFSLRMIYRTQGSSLASSISPMRDYEYIANNPPDPTKDILQTPQTPRRQTTTPQQLTYPNLGTNAPKQRDITIIIDDKFLTDQKISDELNAYATSIFDSNSNPFSNKSKVTNQPLLQPTLVSADTNNDNIPSSATYFENEYGKEKLNDMFMLDYASINSLTKTINFGNIDGTASLFNQYMINTLGVNYNSSNGQTIATQIPPDIVKSFSIFAGAISDQAINDTGYMPGTQQFEIQFLKLLSQSYDPVNGNVNNTSYQSPSSSNKQSSNLQTQTDNLNISLNSVSTEDRKLYLQNVLRNYLFNRPMGIRYAFFTGKLSATIHGTSGLGFGQGIYVRGLISSMDAWYALGKIRHTINQTWSTELEGTIVGSPVLQENLRILALTNTATNSTNTNSNNNGTGTLPTITSSSVPGTLQIN